MSLCSPVEWIVRKLGAEFVDAVDSYAMYYARGGVVVLAGGERGVELVEPHPMPDGHRIAVGVCFDGAIVFYGAVRGSMVVLDPEPLVTREMLARVLEEAVDRVYDGDGIWPLPFLEAYERTLGELRMRANLEQLARGVEARAKLSLEDLAS